MRNSVSNRYIKTGLDFEASAELPKDPPPTAAPLLPPSPQSPRPQEAFDLNERGLNDYNRGRFPEALNYFQQALVIHREVGNRAGEGTTLNNIGLVYDNQGQYDQALNQYQQALVIVRECMSEYACVHAHMPLTMWVTPAWFLPWHSDYDTGSRYHRNLTSAAHTRER